VTFELDLTGRRALVTGAGQGVGRSVVLGLAAAGAEVLVNDLDAARADAVVDEVGAASGTARASVFDVTDHAAVLDAVTDLGVDVLVNNAGLSHHSLAADAALPVLRRVMDVNFHGAVHCTLAALPDLEARRGVVVAMSSVAGFGPLYRRSAYAASNYGAQAAGAVHRRPPHRLPSSSMLGAPIGAPPLSSLADGEDARRRPGSSHLRAVMNTRSTAGSTRSGARSARAGSP